MPDTEVATGLSLFQLSLILDHLQLLPIHVTSVSFPDGRCLTCVSVVKCHFFVNGLSSAPRVNLFVVNKKKLASNPTDSQCLLHKLSQFARGDDGKRLEHKFSLPFLSFLVGKVGP